MQIGLCFCHPDVSNKRLIDYLLSIIFASLNLLTVVLR